MVDATNPLLTDVVTITPRVRTDNGRPPATVVVTHHTMAILVCMHGSVVELENGISSINMNYFTARAHKHVYIDFPCFLSKSQLLHFCTCQGFTPLSN